MEDKLLFISSLNSELFNKEIRIKGILKKRKGIKAMKVENEIKHYTTFNLNASNGIDCIEVIYFHNSAKELYDLDENEGNPIVIYGKYKYNEKGNDIHTYIESNKFDILEIPPFNIDNLTSSDRTEYKVIEQIIDKLYLEKPEICFEDICNEASKNSIDKNNVKKILDKLKQEGIIFEPRRDIFRKLV